MNATALRVVSVLERMRVAIEPITRRWLGSPLDDAQAGEAPACARSSSKPTR